MRRISVIFLTVLLGLSLTACDGKNKDGESTSQDGSSVVSQESDGNNNENSEVAAKSAAQIKTDLINIVRDGSKLGEVQEITKSNVITLKGLVMTSSSGQHNYPSAEDLLTKGYKMKLDYAEYYLDEFFTIYADVDSQKPLSLYVVNDKDLGDSTKVSMQDIMDICEEKSYFALIDAYPDMEHDGALGSTFVPEDTAEPGLYDIFIAREGKMYYMIQIKITKAPASASSGVDVEPVQEEPLPDDNAAPAQE